MSNDAAQLFNVFVEAKTALEELPKVRKDLDAAQELLNETSDALTREQHHSADLANALAALQAKLAQTEAALADATKSQAERDQLLNSLRNLLGSGGGDNRPVSETVAPSQSRPTQFVDFLVEELPKEDREKGNEVSSADGNATSESQTANSIVADGNQPVSAETHSEAEAPSPAFPTHPSEYDPSFAILTAKITGETASEATASTPLPGDADYRSYSDASYWEKPAEMTWERFESLGGKAPSWIWDKSVA